MPSFNILRSCKPAQLAAWYALLLLFVQVTHQAPSELSDAEAIARKVSRRVW